MLIPSPVMLFFSLCTVFSLCSARAERARYLADDGRGVLKLTTQDRAGDEATSETIAPRVFIVSMVCNNKYLRSYLDVDGNIYLL